MIFNNFQGFVQATRRKLEIRRQLLMQEETIGIIFDPDEINKIIAENIHGFLIADLRKVKEMVAYLRSIDFKDDTIKDMAIRSFIDFSSIEVYKLRNMIESFKIHHLVGADLVEVSPPYDHSENYLFGCCRYNV